MAGPSILDAVEQSLSPTKIGIEEFCESSAFCGKPLYPRQLVLLKLIFLEEMTGAEEDVLDHWIAGGRNGTEVSISPNIRERRDYLREFEYPHFSEVDLIGGRRSSKGFITGLAMTKVLWETLQLQDPGDHYGIDPGKEIYFSCISASESQAKKTQYADLSDTIQECQAIDPYLIKSLETEIRVATPADLIKIQQAKARGNRIQKDIARLRGDALAANAATLRGRAIMSYCMDEVAHMLPGDSQSSAEQVFNAAGPSMRQFGRDGIAFINSSPYTKVGLFYVRAEKAFKPFDRALHGTGQPGMGEPVQFALQFGSSSLFDGYQKITRRWCPQPWRKVVTASPDWDPEEKDADGDDLWSWSDKIEIEAERGLERDNPEAYKVERRGKFAEVVDAFLNPTQVDRMFMGVPTTWTRGVDGVDRPVMAPLMTNHGDEAINTFRYKFHLDPSSTTAGFGFAIGHTEYFVNAQGIEEEHVVFDLLKRWNPKDFNGGVIRWAPIIEEVLNYAQTFYPFEITMDQHQSAEPIQDLQERLTIRNIPTRVYERTATNELNWRRWETFKTCLYQGRIHAPFDVPDSKLAALELKFLQEKNTGSRYPRVDRQEIGPVQTRDIADCLSEVTYSLIGNMMVNRARDRLSNSSLIGGSAGGYGIGQGPIGGIGPPGISEYYSQSGGRGGGSNPARGVTGRGRGRSNSYRTRGR